MKRQFTFRFPASARAAIVLLAATLASLSASGEEDRNIISPAPPWELAGVDGKTVKSSDFQGKVVILNFWATWCAPCREEIPGLVRLQQKYGDKGLVVIGASIDEQGADAVKRFAKQFHMSYPVVLASEKIINDFGSFEGIPTTFIIDRQGQIVRRHMGYANRETFEKEIQPLL